MKSMVIKRVGSPSRTRTCDHSINRRTDYDAKGCGWARILDPLIRDSLHKSTH
jgi:hypothetical protein